MEKLELGSKFNQYIIEEEIGAGGMGKVYKAWDEKLNRHVAIKILNVDAIPRDSYEEWYRRFISEARTLAQLNHANVMSIYDISDDPKNPYIVMEMIQGNALDNDDRFQEFSMKKFLEIFKKLADAFSYIHEQGIIHRDIKPGNIVLSKDGEPKIIDFGIARWDEDPERFHTKTHHFVGSVHYSAPELFEFTRPSVKADIFAFGVTMANMINEEKIFYGENITDTIKAIRYEEPHFNSVVKNNLPIPLYGCLIRMVEKDPRDRYESMKEVSEVLYALITSLQDSYLENTLEEVQVSSITIENDGVKGHIRKSEPVYTMTLSRGDLEVIKDPKKSKKSKKSKKKGTKKRNRVQKKKVKTSTPYFKFAAVAASVVIISFFLNKRSSQNIEKVVSTVTQEYSNKNNFQIKELTELAEELSRNGYKELVPELLVLEQNLIKVKPIDEEIYEKVLIRVERVRLAVKRNKKFDYKSEIERGTKVIKLRFLEEEKNREISSE